MPTSTFQEQGTVTPVASVHVDYVAMSLYVSLALVSEERRCQSRPGQAARVCWTVDHVTVCNELESALSSFFGSSSA